MRTASLRTSGIVTAIAAVALLCSALAGCGDDGGDGACGTGTTDCAGTCRDLDVDPDHCGACGNACEPGVACVEGVCTFECVGGTTDCGGACRNLDTDRENCGACDNVCEQNEDCVEGACEGPECTGGLLDCDGFCADSQIDPFNCGTCGTQCDEGEVCRDGECGIACGGGSTDCGGVCRDLRVDPAHCGECDNPCGGGEVCNSGSCAASCGDLTDCGGACVDTDSDASHCSGCDSPCEEDEACVGSVCTPLKSSGCADIVEEVQALTANMVGCAGTVGFNSRATLCDGDADWAPCTAAEWMDRRPGRTVPAYNYWTDDNLRYDGNFDSCWVSLDEGTNCRTGGRFSIATPMRVCRTDGEDDLGNTCNWQNCGYEAAPPPNHYFGGCSGNTTAGTLCCR